MTSPNPDRHDRTGSANLRRPGLVLFAMVGAIALLGTSLGWRLPGGGLSGDTRLSSTATQSFNSGQRSPAASARDRPGPGAKASPPGSPSPAASPSADPSGEASAGPTMEPSAEPEPSARPSLTANDRVATRVTLPDLRIDLPVMLQPTPYPPCGVAMYLKELRQPGQDGVTYLYAHAQTPGFEPIYRASRVNNGRRLLGMRVLVFTGDNLLFTYRISEVRRHQTNLDDAWTWEGESLWLQTSEGVGDDPKVQVVAELTHVAPTDHASAHPSPRPLSCA